jgi:hypothetical protein
LAIAGSYDLSVSSNHTQSQTGTLTVLKGKPTANMNLKFDTESERPLHLRLVDQQHHPRAGLVSKTIYRGPVPTASDGTLDMEPMIGQYEWAFAIDKSNELGAVIPHHPDPGDLGDIVLEPLITLMGQVVDQDGTPEPDAQISSTYIGPGGGRYGTALIGSVTMSVDGHFTARCVANVEGFGIDFRSPAGWAQRNKFSNSPGAKHDLGVIHLSGNRADAIATLSGRVLDEAGIPIAGAALYGPNGNFAPTKTDHLGRYFQTDLRIGEKILIDVNTGSKNQEFPDIATNQENIELRFKPRGYQLLNHPAPNLNVSEWLNPGPTNFAVLRGKVILLQLGDQFGELDGQLKPLLDATKKYGDKGLYTIAIHNPLKENSWIVAGQLHPVTRQDVTDYLKNHDIRIPFAIDTSGAHSMFGSYYCWQPGEFCLIDKNGNVAACPDEKDLDQWIEKLLAQ